MKICTTCRHWMPAVDPDDELAEYRSHNDWQAEKIGYRKCMRIIARWKHQDKVDPTLQQKWRSGGATDKSATEAYWKAVEEAVVASKAYVQDGSEYVADMFTAPDFGCVLHETQTEKET